jgi:hypothetical protein
MEITEEELEKMLVARTLQLKGLVRGREILITALLRVKEKVDPALQTEIDRALGEAEAALTDTLFAS